MPGLDELRKRVEAAEQQFGLITTQSRKYSERLTQLVSQMEQTHGQQHKEIAALNARLGQYEQENGQLKSMLLGLLQAMENGDDSLIGHTVRDMEGRIGRLIGVVEPVAEAVPDADAGHAADDDAEAGLIEDLMGEDDGPDANIEPEEVMIEDEAAPADAIDEELVALDDDLIEVAEAVADGVGETELGDDAVAEDVAVLDEAVTQAEAPTPETVTLDDDPEEGDADADDDALAASAHSLLDRVEAAANALLAAGADSGADVMDSELTDEISALLERAVNGTSDEADDMAALMLNDEAEADEMAAFDEMADAGEEPAEDDKADAA